MPDPDAPASWLPALLPSSLCLPWLPMAGTPGLPPSLLVGGGTAQSTLRALPPASASRLSFGFRWPPPIRPPAAASPPSGDGELGGGHGERRASREGPPCLGPARNFSGPCLGCRLSPWAGKVVA
uniref:Secreted protein n=1 Tax=Setaria viridis TaxID=4556 RepID=A0A4U6WFG8_SETVI|nr:hypothetical protein SEVIR_1G314550v2 [Setaria viridis]